jgi:hypothetical protein
MKGSIYFHSKFEFKDGAIGEKLLIVLNEPTSKDPYLVVKTTSQLRYGHPYSKGCNKKLGVFYIEANAEGGFLLPTLIQLLDIYPFTKEQFLKGCLTDKVIAHKAILSTLTMAQVMNCIKQLQEDISEEYFALLTK